jgi:hypothetical protein
MLDLLKSLSKKELEEFHSFLSSPFFNQEENNLKLYNFLVKKLNQANLIEIKMDAEDPFRYEIYSWVFKKEKFNELKFKRLVSDFTHLFKKFIMIKNFMGHGSTGDPENFLFEISIMKELENKNLKRLSEPVAKALSKKLEIKRSKDDEYYSAKFQLENLLFYANYGKDAGMAEHFLRSKSLSADLQFIFTKLHSYREMIIFSESLSKENSFSPEKDFFYDHIIDFIRKNKIMIRNDHPNLYFIYLTVMMYQSGGEKFSIEFLNYLSKIKYDFPKEKLKYYYTYITSYYWSRINKGDQKFRKDLIKVYKKMVAEDLLMLERYMPDHTFNSIIMIGISEKEFGWVEEFISKYKNAVDPAKAKDAVNLANAKMFFYKRKFDDAIDHLKNVEFKNTIYFSNAKVLLAKIYYEQNDQVSLNYLIESLTQYTRRNKKLVPEQVILINSFIKYMKQLIRYKEKKGMDIIVLRKELDNEKNYVPDRNWFYEKIREMEM